MCTSVGGNVRKRYPKKTRKMIIRNISYKGKQLPKELLKNMKKIINLER